MNVMQLTIDKKILLITLMAHAYVIKAITTII